jgi:hypothetical protein
MCTANPYWDEKYNFVFDFLRWGGEMQVHKGGVSWVWWGRLPNRTTGLDT